MRHWIIACLISCMMMPAATAGDAGIDAAQSVIQKQLQAFRGGRDAEAYSYASPVLRQIFPTADVFMTMVRKGYPMVHHPAHFAFGAAEEPAPGQIKQDVMIIGQDGKDYVASYTLQQQPDGSWLINSVSLRAGGTLST